MENKKQGFLAKIFGFVAYFFKELWDSLSRAAGDGRDDRDCWRD